MYQNVLNGLDQLVYVFVQEVITEHRNNGRNTSWRVLRTVNVREIENTLGVQNVHMYRPSILDGNETGTDEEQLEHENADVLYYRTPWCSGDVTGPVGGPIPEVNWEMNTSTGEKIVQGCDREGSPRGRIRLNYFLTMSPPDQLHRITILTSALLLE